jgi:hypothetical protein
MEMGHDRLPCKVKPILLRNSIATANCAALALALSGSTPLAFKHRQRCPSRLSADSL